MSAVFYLNHREVRDWTPAGITLVEDVAARMWDAPERARAETELRELNLTLERRVQERTAELLFAEEALRQSQKMEAVGQLTGGIAHGSRPLGRSLTVTTLGARSPSAKSLRRSWVSNRLPPE